MKRLDSRTVTVRRVFDWFDRQCLAVPEIQREFVWNAQRACDLLDSIYKGLLLHPKAKQSRIGLIVC